MAIEYIYSNTGLYDKYGRLSYVDGELTNTYDINPEFANGSYSVEGIDNGSAKLATVTDLLTKPMFIAMIILETLPVQRPIHRGSWIGGIFVGIYSGFNGVVY